MKKTCFALAVFLFAISAYGWRDQEMEIKFTALNGSQLSTLRDLNLNGEVTPPGDATMYVTPDELQKVKAAGLPYRISIADLNAYYKDFWQRKVPTGYSTYDQIISAMDSLQRVCPAICKKIVTGKSIQNRDICVLKISNNVAVDENEAEIILDGGIHGDEIGGPENLIKFARELCSGYTTSADIKKLIDSREIFLYIMVNPDGRMGTMSRTNSAGVDCNRDGGYMWGAQGSSTGPYSQQEIKAARNFYFSNQPSVQISYHSGTEYILYPWGFTGTTSPDLSHHRYLTNLYASSSTYSTLPVYQSFNTYQTFGETLDYMYGCMGTAALTEEISANKQPSDVQGYYDKNAPAMKKLIEYAGYGVQGVVSDAATKQPVAALIYVNQSFPCYCDPVVGDYHKFLIAGTYSIRAWANGYTAKTVSQIAVQDQKTTTTNIELDRDPAAKVAWGYRVISVLSGTGNTFTVLGPQDNLYFSLSGSQGMVVDMQYPIENITGKEITVYISGSSATYTCFAGQSPDGPWKSLGTSTRTDSFDLAAGTLQNAQYVRVQGTNINLDAISGIKSYGSAIRSDRLISSARAGITVSRKDARYAIRCNNRARASLRIFTAQGRCCLSTSIDNGYYMWRPPCRGMYIARIAGDGSLITQPFAVTE